MEKENWIVTQLKNSTVYFLVLIVVVVIFGIRLQERVMAIEIRNNKTDPLVERFLQLEERDKILVEDVKEIKESVKNIEKFLRVIP